MILDDIIAATKIRVEKAKQAIPLEEMKQAALALPINQDFPFEKALTGEGIRFICECKKASPSKGVIVEDFPYLEIAKSYEEAGASAISVLTEPDFFQGENRFLTEGNWNLGSALSLIMMVLILISLSILRKADPEGEGGGMV